MPRCRAARRCSAVPAGACRRPIQRHRDNDGDPTLGSNRTTSRIFGGAAVPTTALAGYDGGLRAGRRRTSNVITAAGAPACFRPAPSAPELWRGLHHGGARYGWQDVTTDRTQHCTDVLRARFNRARSRAAEGGYHRGAVLGGWLKRLRPASSRPTGCQATAK